MPSVRILTLPLVLLLALAGLRLFPGLTPAGAEPAPTRADCTRTLKPGADVASAIGAARGGSTVCLAGGSYGEIEASGVKKSRPVTVRPVPGARAEVNGIELLDPSGLRFVGLHLRAGVSVSPSAHDLQFLDNDITGSNGIYLFGDYRIGKRVEDVLIEGNTIHDIDYWGTRKPATGTESRASATSAG